MAIHYGESSIPQISRPLKGTTACYQVDNQHWQPFLLQILNLPSLYYCRLRGEVIFMYQISHHNLDASLLDLFQPALITCTRGHIFKYFKPQCKTRCRYNFFSCRNIDNWNNLPAYIVNVALFR